MDNYEMTKDIFAEGITKLSEILKITTKNLKFEWIFFSNASLSDKIIDLLEFNQLIEAMNLITKEEVIDLIDSDDGLIKALMARYFNKDNESEKEEAIYKSTIICAWLIKNKTKYRITEYVRMIDSSELLILMELNPFYRYVNIENIINYSYNDETSTKESNEIFVKHYIGVINMFYNLTNYRALSFGSDIVTSMFNKEITPADAYAEFLKRIDNKCIDLENEITLEGKRIIEERIIQNYMEEQGYIYNETDGSYKKKNW